MDRSWVVVSVIVGLLALSLAIAVGLQFYGADLGLDSGSANIAHIVLEGEISDHGAGSSFFSGGASSRDLVDQIEQAASDPYVDAIMIEINSPGGAVVASKDIARAISKAEKPTIGWVRDVAASGGYWAASATDYIIADSLSVTGSIGVVASQLGFEGILSDYNISYRQLIAGKYKDAGTPYREMSNEEKKLFQNVLDTIHTEFIQSVATNRNMEEKKVREAATGMFYLGVQAKELGLIDEIGGKDEVETYLKNTLNVTSLDYVDYEEEPGFFELLTGLSSSFSFNLGKGFADGFRTQMQIQT